MANYGSQSVTIPQKIFFSLQCFKFLLLLPEYYIVYFKTQLDLEESKNVIHTAELSLT